MGLEEVGKQSIDYSERALRLDKYNADVLAIVGRHRAFLHGVDEETIALVKHAIELNPNSASAWMHCGWVHVYAGQSENAVAQFERSTRLSPRDPNNFETLAGLANALIQLGRDEEAVAAARTAVQQGPNFTPSWRYLISALAHTGRTDEAHSDGQPPGDRTFVQLASL